MGQAYIQGEDVPKICKVKQVYQSKICDTEVQEFALPCLRDTYCMDMR